MRPGDQFVYLAWSIEVSAGLLATGAAVVALLYVWRGTRRVQQLYWTTFVMTIAGNLLLALADWSYDVGLWRSALFGPGPNRDLLDPLERLNVASFWLLLWFFSAPLLRRWIRRRSTAASS
jgi:hypothetical protein